MSKTGDFYENDEPIADVVTAFERGEPTVTTRSPTWNILIATLGQRHDRLSQLLRELLPQVDAQHGRVTVTALFNHGERSLGEVRHSLLTSATADYVSFVDDDDSLPDYHVAEVLCALDDDPDYVGWQMQCYVDGRRMKPTYHSLRYARWYEDDRGYYRDVSHLNPIRTSIAQRGDFRRGVPPEDVNWVDQVRPYVRTERYVDKIMYYYHASSVDTTWRKNARIRRRRFPRPTFASPNFSFHPEST